MVLGGHRAASVPCPVSCRGPPRAGATAVRPGRPRGTEEQHREGVEVHTRSWGNPGVGSVAGKVGGARRSQSWSCCLSTLALIVPALAGAVTSGLSGPQPEATPLGGLS